MAELIYSALASLDGYVNDEHGNFDWAAPDEQVHAFVNEQERPIGTYLYGRRMYDVMRFWETAGEDLPAAERDYAEIWRGADKIVYSTTLDQPTTARTTIERAFDPGSIRALKESSKRDISIGGPTLAAEALAAGLVDRINLVLVPVVVGGGTKVLPDDVRTSLELLEEGRFASGAVHLAYAVRRTVD